jgi:hypothetical protein
MDKKDRRDKKGKRAKRAEESLVMDGDGAAEVGQ